MDFEQERIAMKANNEKYWKHLWKYPYVGDDLNSFLEALTKTDLDEIKRSLVIPVKSNAKKAELLADIKKDYYTHLENYLLCCSKEQFSDIEKILKNEKVFECDNYTTRFYFYSGIAFPVTRGDERVLLIPTETKELLNRMKSQFIKESQLNSEIINIAIGLIEYYGVIPIPILWNIIESYYPNKFELTNPRIHNVIMTGIVYSQEFDFDDPFVYNLSLNLEEVRTIYREQVSKNIDYYPINKFRALQASKDFFIEMTPQVTTLMKYLRNNYDFDEDELEEAIFDMVTSIKKGVMFTEYLNDLNERIEYDSMEQANIIFGMVQEVHNNTRMWPLRGYTPMEFGELKKSPSAPVKIKSQIRPEIKIGRNDPCTCGSGKKYKHCCLTKDES